jgi:hypothetical protein
MEQKTSSLLQKMMSNNSISESGGKYARFPRKIGGGWGGGGVGEGLWLTIGTFDVEK